MKKRPIKKSTLIIALCALNIMGLIGAIVSLGIDNKNAATPNNPLNALPNVSKKTASIGLISMDAPISFAERSGGFLPSPSGASHWLRQLKVAETNKNIKAVIIQVNSPGGTVGASQELYSAVSKVQKAGKPVVVSVSDMSASGGYYATAGADRMFANGGSIVGSIGVIMQGVEYTELLSKLGIKANTIKSGNNKDILSPFRGMTPQEREILTASVLDTYEQFVKVVAEGRKMSVDQVKPLADGRIYTGQQALKLGLVDELGTFDDALEYTRKTYELADAELTSIQVPMPAFKISDLIPMAQTALNPKIEVNLPKPMSASPILYLYQF
ncbi:MAG: signal peptide peptidase SppA [Brevinema sp.]